MIKLFRAVWLPSSLTIGFAGLSIITEWYLLLAICAILIVDVRGRLSDYRRLIAIQNKSPLKTVEYWDNFSYTRCSREVMIVVDPQSKTYYKLLGYRWYHLFPDDFFTLKSPIFKRNFWYNFSGPKL